MQEIFADPYGELPLQNDKFASLCTDLHLGGRKIGSLRDFERFISLDTLWLNNNNLTSIDGLEENFRIKSLFLHSNRIRRLQVGSFWPFRFLARLTINDNQLDDMEGTLQELKYLRHLTSLDLFNNPIAQEDNYRLRVIGELPQLLTLDRHNVTTDERKEAKRMKANLKKLKSFSLIESHARPSSPSSSLQLEEERARSEQALQRILQLLSHHAKEKRCFIEQDFLLQDKRRLGIVSEDYFWSVLSAYNLAQLLNENERVLLMDKYKTTSTVVSISMTGTLPRDAVEYGKFCRDLLPISLRVIKDEWKTEKVPEISATVKDLENYVGEVRRRNEREKERNKRATLFGSDVTAGAENNSSSGSCGGGYNCGNSGKTLSTANSQAVASSSSSKPSRDSEEFGLDPWQSAELARIVSDVEALATAAANAAPAVEMTKAEVKASAALVPSPVKLTRQQVDAVFKRMAAYGKAPDGGRAKALALLFRHDSASILPADFRAAIGCPCKSKEVAAAVVKGNKKKSQAVAATTAGAATDASSSLSRDGGEVYRKIRWKAISDEEAARLESKMFSDSANMLQSLLQNSSSSSSSSSDDKASKLFLQTMSSGIGATRLSAMNTEHRGSRRRNNQAALLLSLSPMEVIAGAAPRADVFVIPNLKASASAKTLLLRPIIQQSSSTNTPHQTTALHSSSSSGSVGLHRNPLSSASSLSSSLKSAPKSSLPAPLLKDDPLLQRWTQGTKTIVLNSTR